MVTYNGERFPHSEISGSTDICSSPKLIAACHVLLRLLMPRHSPCALSSLTYYSSLVLSFFELCRPQRSFFQLNCSVTLPYPFLPEISVPLFASFLAILTPRKYCSSLLPCFFPSFLVQFSRCKYRRYTFVHLLN